MTRSAAFAIVLLVTGCNDDKDPGPIKLGGGFALTGGNAALDLPGSNGARLAVKELNEAGGVLGREIELIVHDSQYDMTLVADIARRWVEEDEVVAVVGYSDSDSVLNSAPTTQSAGIPYLTFGATSPYLPETIGDLMFLTPFGDHAQAAAGAQYGYENVGKKAYRLWNKDQVYTRLESGFFEITFEELGGTIVAKEEYNDSDVEFADHIEAIKASYATHGPDDFFVYFSAFPYTVGKFLKQLREAGYDGPVVGGDGWDAPILLEEGGTGAEKTFFSTHVLLDDELGSTRVIKFMNAYEAEYGHRAENAFAALAYDAVNLMASAIRRAGSTEASKIKNALESTTNFPGVTSNITLTPTSHVPEKTVTIIAVVNGKFTLGAEFVPDFVPSPDSLKL